jgi:hypothetical protein
VPRYNKPVAAVIPLAAKHTNVARLEPGVFGNSPESFGHPPTRSLHQLQAGNANPLNSQAVNFTHFLCGKNFHGRQELAPASCRLGTALIRESPLILIFERLLLRTSDDDMSNQLKASNRRSHSPLAR